MSATSQTTKNGNHARRSDVTLGFPAVSDLAKHSRAAANRKFRPSDLLAAELSYELPSEYQVDAELSRWARQAYSSDGTERRLCSPKSAENGQDAEALLIFDHPRLLPAAAVLETFDKEIEIGARPTTELRPD